MSVNFQFDAVTRTGLGKAVSRRMRHNGEIPAVIYGGKDEGAQSITMNHNQVITALGHEAVYSHILKIKMDDGAEQQVVIKDIQRHPYKLKVLHVDFLRVNATEQLTMHVPLHFIGEEEAPGVKADGVVSKLMTDIEIKCLPAALPEFIELDMSGLEMGHSLHISDIKLPKGVELAQLELDEAHDHPVVSIHEAREEPEPEVEAAAEDAEAAEGEKGADEAAEDKSENEGDTPAAEETKE